MAFTVFTDGSANLSRKMLDGIRLLPCVYRTDHETIQYEGDVESFDGHEFYKSLKQGKKVKTTLLNPYQFISAFEPVLKEDMDIIYISMSSEISGTYNVARMAAEDLLEKFPDRKIEIIDSLGCGFGSGMLAVKAAVLNRNGVDISTTVQLLNDETQHICQYFTVDDLKYLKESGRVSGIVAQIGTLMHVKPILFGDNAGQIVFWEKIRGRKAAIQFLAQKYAEKVVNPGGQTVCISHGDCMGDAEILAKLINAKKQPRSIVICQHEPFSGSHVGPGMLGIFFYGRER